MIPSFASLACCAALWAAPAAEPPQIDWRVRDAAAVKTIYDIDWRRIGGGSPPSGWGVYAAAQGQTLDFDSRAAGWVQDPFVGPDQIQAGFGWRQPDMVFMFGFNRPAWIRTQPNWLEAGGRAGALRGDYHLDIHPQSVVGVSLSFHLQ